MSGTLSTAMGSLLRRGPVRLFDHLDKFQKERQAQRQRMTPTSSVGFRRRSTGVILPCLPFVDCRRGGDAPETRIRRLGAASAARGQRGRCGSLQMVWQPAAGSVCGPCAACSTPDYGN